MCSPGGAQRATDPRAGQVHASQPFYPIAREEREGWGGDKKRERGGEREEEREEERDRGERIWDDEKIKGVEVEEGKRRST